MFLDVLIAILQIPSQITLNGANFLLKSVPSAVAEVRSGSFAYKENAEKAL